MLKILCSLFVVFSSYLRKCGTLAESENMNSPFRDFRELRSYGKNYLYLNFSLKWWDKMLRVKKVLKKCVLAKKTTYSLCNAKNEIISEIIKIFQNPLGWWSFLGYWSRFYKQTKNRRWSIWGPGWIGMECPTIYGFPFTCDPLSVVK